MPKMKIKCNDGIVRNFIVAYADGDYLPDGSRQNGFSSSFCDECDECFGCHSIVVLKPLWRKHTCKSIVK